MKTIIPQSHNGGFSFADSVMAVLLSSMIFTALIPVLTLSRRRLPEMILQQHKTISLLNLHRDLVSIAEQIHCPYWSDGIVTEIDEHRIRIKNNNRNILIEQDGEYITLESNSVKRQYKVGADYTLTLIDSAADYGFILHSGDNDYHIPFSERPLNRFYEQK